ncbi:MAG: 2-oxoacid:acceptor oxidoreductase family protein [Armatimonadetes bacterium]|nr:2-oxoacid:acceptor oxidoreductase family protein [Armatimonadota bacterium]
MMGEGSASSFEIAIHGRGGQAAKTAGEVIVHTLYRKGFSPHGQPRYTADRMGAPVSYAIRFRPDRARIFDRSWVRHPQVVVLCDISLVEQLDLAPTWRPGITVIVNAAPESPGLAALAAFRVARVDANRIAREVGLMKGSVPILSTAMAGAFARVSGLITLDDVLEALRREGTAAVGQNLEANIQAAHRGFAEVEDPVEPAR